MNALTLNGRVVWDEKMFEDVNRSSAYVILAKSYVLEETADEQQTDLVNSILLAHL